jgi:hypothetical protein
VFTFLRYYEKISKKVIMERKKMNNQMLKEYWQFACERQNVFYKKLKKQSEPYTNDIILQKFKFCNAYRVLDRVSQFLLKEVIYGKKKYGYEDTVFRILFFKIFNLPSTWVEVEKHFKEISLKTFEFDKYSQFLTNLKKTKPIYNNAYIMCANKVFGFHSKHENHLYLLKKMFQEDNLPKKLANCNTFEDAFYVIVSYPLIGNFLAYQYTTDLNYSDYFNWDDNSFTVAGPGSKRGIQKVFGKVKNFEQKIMETYANQEKQLNYFGLNFNYLKNHKLSPIDIQNLFCEFDKYLREARPNLKSNRTKIKTKYKKTKGDISYILPPKWKAAL